MKLKVSHLFFLLLGVLLLSNLGLSIKEGLKNSDDDPDDDSDDNSDNWYSDEYKLKKRDRAGNDDYILKSRIVPPVCPKCPDVTVCPKCGGDSKPQPCPPCGRCPKPAFKCAKVPDYSSSQSDGSLPRPMLSDFSQFSKPTAM